MQLKQLQFFVISVDMGSFKEAAEVLYTSQPHISKTIKALEEELGILLLDRQANGLVMTEQGRKVYKYASDVLRSTEMISNLSEEKGKDKFSISTNFGCHLSEIYLDFYRKHEKEDVKFQFREGTMEEVIQHLHKHVVDIGFVYIASRQYFALQDMLRYKRLSFHLIKRTQPFLFVGPAHPIYDASSVTPQQMRCLKLVQPREDFFSFTNHLGHLKDDMGAFKKNSKMVITDSDQVMIRFLQDTDLAYVGSSIMTGLFEHFQIRGIPIESDTDCIYFGYIKRIQDELSPFGKEFIRYLERCQRYETI